MKTRHQGVNARIYKTAWALLMGHHAACIVVGAAGFVFQSSPSIDRATASPVFGYLWSAIFILFGILALFARYKEKVTAEMVAILAIALARGLWCVTILVSAYQRDSTGTVQVGLALLATALFMSSWAAFTTVWVRTGLIVVAGRGDFPTDLIREHLKRIAKEAIEEGGRTK